MEEKCYKILPFAEAEKIIKSGGRSALDYDFQLKNASAVVHRLNGGIVILTSGSLINEEESLIFNNYDCFDSFLQEEVFPIENPNKDLWEFEQENLKNLPVSLPYFMDALNEQFHIVDLNENSLSSLTREIRLAKRENLSEKEIISTTVLVCEFLRRNNKWEWLYKKNYGAFNKYLVPILYDPENQLVFDIFGRIPSYLLQSNGDIKLGIKNIFLAKGSPISILDSHGRIVR